MTSNAIAYNKAAQEIAETKRSNRAKERETKRSNLEKEAETRRSNIAKERLDKYKSDITALSKAKGALGGVLGNKGEVLSYMAAQDFTNNVTGQRLDGQDVNRDTADKATGYSGRKSSNIWRN